MSRTIRLALALWLLALAGCEGDAPTAMPPPAVGVVIVQPESFANIIEVPGRIQAVRTAQVRARVDGIVQERVYEEGSDVKAGQVLFRIDPRELRAKVSAVEAALLRAQATAANAAQDVERYEGLVEDEAISKQEFDAALARLRTAEADVAQTMAELEAARLNLSYTVVTAPIDGRAGRAQVTEGALVSAASATLLTTIEQLDPVYVNFSQSSSDLLAIRRDMAAGTLNVPEIGLAEVLLILEDGTTYPHVGHLDFLDLSIDETTGTAAVRAEVPNPERILLPGQFVRARIEAGTREGAFLVPQRAVQLNAQGAVVFIADENDTAVVREVKLGSLKGSHWVVFDGLSDGDRVIVDGLQKVQPGAPVSIAQSTPATAPDTQAQDPDRAETER